MPQDENRRPIRARSSRWAQAVAQALARSSITPNQISVASAIFASVGALILLLNQSPVALIGCVVFIQLRLICNLLDGMVAVEGGKKSALGGLYNEFPDRIADSVLIVALGYAAQIPWVGWLGALAAGLTAYVRLFGGSIGLSQDFRGPMAKQHRMAVMTIGCLGQAIESAFGATHWALYAASVLIALGSLATCVTRTLAIAGQLRKS
jgi:phosphatidylglycerophosphate synthase